MTIRRSRDGTHASVAFEATGLTALALATQGWGKHSEHRANTGLWFGTDLQVAFYDVADAAAMLAALDQARGTNDLAS